MYTIRASSFARIRILKSLIDINLMKFQNHKEIHFIQLHSNNNQIHSNIRLIKLNYSQENGGSWYITIIYNKDRTLDHRYLQIRHKSFKSQKSNPVLEPQNP